MMAFWTAPVHASLAAAGATFARCSGGCYDALPILAGYATGMRDHAVGALEATAESSASQTTTARVPGFLVGKIEKHPAAFVGSVGNAGSLRVLLESISLAYGSVFRGGNKSKSVIRHIADAEAGGTGPYNIVRINCACACTHGRPTDQRPTGGFDGREIKFLIV